MITEKEKKYSEELSWNDILPPRVEPSVSARIYSEIPTKSDYFLEFFIIAFAVLMFSYIVLTAFGKI